MIEKFVVLAEYFEQQTDWSTDIREKLSNEGEVLRTLGGISRIHLSLSTKWKSCQGAISSWPRNFRTALERYFRFH